MRTNTHTRATAAAMAAVVAVAMTVRVAISQKSASLPMKRICFLLPIRFHWHIYLCATHTRDWLNRSMAIGWRMAISWLKWSTYNLQAIKAKVKCNWFARVLGKNWQIFIVYQRFAHEMNVIGAVSQIGKALLPEFTHSLPARFKFHVSIFTWIFQYSACSV